MKITAILIMCLTLATGDKKDIFSTKAIENRMVRVSDQLYANKYETTNAEYREFLEWAKTSSADSFESLEVLHEGWNDLFKKEYSTHYFTNKGFDEYPVVNITHKAALAYCEWLTDKYHSLKKRKYHQVKFRLPTEEEWLTMAYNGRDPIIKYPWGSPYLTNRNGGFMAQFRRIGNSSIKMDIHTPGKIEVASREGINGQKAYGSEAMITKVDSYLATGPGLHQLSGNAAEMLAEEGRTKGGSWGSSGYYLQIAAEDEFTGITSSPYVGFRYVMEVIEE